jgi:hypothetical protein
MGRRETMSAGGVTLAGLGVLVGLAVGSGEGGPKLIAQRTQPVEVRTEVIRKTVNVYRRAHPRHVAGTGPGGTGPAGASAAGSRAAGSSAGGAVVGRTRSSGAGAVAPTSSAAPVVRTASSGSKSTSGSGLPSSAGTQVKTRTSGAGSTGGSAKSVSTRSSGGGDGKGGGHDD